MKKISLIAVLLCSIMHINAVETKLSKAALSVQDLSQFRSDDKALRATIEQLVNDAVALFKSKPNVALFDSFARDRKYRIGSGRLFVLDTTGLIYVPEEPLEQPILSNLKDVRHNPGVATLALYNKMLKRGSAWITYPWREYFKTSFIVPVEHENVTYIFGCSFYPTALREEMVAWVDKAVKYFYTEGPIKAWHTFTASSGPFRKGSLYIYAYKPNGFCVAHGDNAALVGKDLKKIVGTRGVTPELIKANDELIKAAEDGTHWVPFTWNNAPKIGYGTLVTATGGEKYVIGSGYFPESTTDKVIELVDAAVASFNTKGRETTIEAINHKGGPFMFGDLFTFMYDMKGNVLADGSNPDLVGQNLLDLQSQTGEYIVQKMISVAKSGGGWTQYDWKNDLMLSYIESVSDASGAAIIGCGTFPDTKRERTIDLVNNAADYFQHHEIIPSLINFGHLGGPYINGDLSVFVFDANGTCRIWGDNYNLIWRNMSKYGDDEGKFLDQMLEVSNQAQGGGWVSYEINKTTKMVFVRKVNKNNTWFLIGSGFYKYVAPKKVGSNKKSDKKKSVKQK